MNKEEYEKIHQWVMASGLQDVLFYKIINDEGKEVVMDRFENFKAFAWNVEQEEREACADIAENWRSNGIPRTGVANKIRARG